LKPIIDYSNALIVHFMSFNQAFWESGKKQYHAFLASLCHIFITALPKNFAWKWQYPQWSWLSTKGQWYCS